MKRTIQYIKALRNVLKSAPKEDLDSLKETLEKAIEHKKKLEYSEMTSSHELNAFYVMM